MARTGATGAGRRWLVVGIAAMVAVGVVQVSRSVSDDGGTAAMRALTAADRAGRADATAADATAAGGMASGESAAGPLPSGLTDAKVVKTGTLDVEIARGHFGSAFARVSTIAAANGGFVASSTSNRDDGGRESAGSLVVRVPADRFDAAREQLARLGEVRSESLKGEDVGGRLTDLDARLRNLRSQEEAMRLLMAKAGTVGETIEVQRQLFGVREQIEQLAAQQARLADAVALSTITVAMAEPGAAIAPDDGSSVADAFRHALTGTQRVVSAVIVTLGYLAPLALLAGLAWLVARPLAARRRRDGVVAAPSA